MPDTNREHTDAGSAARSDTANQASATDPTSSNSQIQIQSTGSGEVRYAAGYRGGPPNHGFPHGVYTNPDTGKKYFLPEPPRIDGSNGPPQTSPLLPIYEYNGPDAPLGPATYLKPPTGPYQAFPGDLEGFNAAQAISSGSGSGSPSNQNAETRLTLAYNGQIFRPLVSHSDVDNDADLLD